MKHDSTLPTALPASTPVAAGKSTGAIRTGISRGMALFLGLFSLLNLLIELRHPKFDANLWWIDLFPLPKIAPLVAQAALLFVAITWLAYAFMPVMVDWRSRVTATAIELLWLFVAWNMLNYYAGLFRGNFHTAFAMPFSFFVAIALWLIWRGVRHERPQRGPKTWGIMLLTASFLAVVFPLLQMICFGLTDYRRPADAVVVFGARVYENGVPSDAVANRVETAVALYNDKKLFISKLILSGGRADGGLASETDAMRKLAMQKGVPFEDILIDPLGVNTKATVHNLTPIMAKIREEFADRHEPTLLAVSDFYHLPRIKMSFELEERNVRTVPVREPLAQLPKFMLREVAALWKYYFDALVN